MILDGPFLDGKAHQSQYTVPVMFSRKLNLFSQLKPLNYEPY